MRTSGTKSRLFSSVLCPVDFSEHSALALRYAAAIAKRARGHLHAVFVNDPLLVAAAAAAYNEASLGAAGQVELKRFIAATLPPRTSSALGLRCHIALGKPAREILRVTDEDEHDLIVLGTKGLNGAKRLLLGSTTAGVLRRSRVPVLAVPPADAARPPAPPTPAWPGRTIVAAIEFGPRAADEVIRAAEVARWFGAGLVLAHVVPVPAMPGWLSAGVDAHVRQSCVQAEDALEALRGEVQGVRTTTVVRAGHPPDEIATLAADHQAGLIVTGLRGQSGLFGEPAGSCAYQVLCHGIAPVLALPDVRRTARR